MGKSNALSHHSDHSSGTEDNRNLTLLRPKFFAVCALKGVTFKGAEHDIMCEIRSGIHEGSAEDAVTLAISGLAKLKGKSLRSAEWHQLDGLWYFHDKIYVPNIPDLCRRIVEQHHDTPIAGHAGHWKTLELVS
jgi:hypothetical protein